MIIFIPQERGQAVRNFIIIMSVLVLSASNSLSTTHMIANSGFSFNPSELTINLGDTVNFVLGSLHSAREVSQATWTSNGITSNGGFETPFGGGIVVLTLTGTHYYVCVNHAFLGMKGTIVVNSKTDVGNIDTQTPTVCTLSQNFPNPFNPSTRISFTIPSSSYVTLKIYNLVGEEVATLAAGERNAGAYEVIWDASRFASGTYYCRLQAGSVIEVKKILLVK